MNLLVRYRLWLVGAIAVVNGVLEVLGPRGVSDYDILAPVGELLFSAQWAHVFDEAWVQVGPLYLVWAGVMSRAVDPLGLAGELLFYSLFYLAFSVGVVFVLRALYRHHDQEPPRWLELVVGMAATIAGFGWIAAVSGQPGETIVFVLFVFVAQAARRDRPVAAGGLLALAIGIKLVAVLGVPLLLLIPEFRHRAGALLIAIGGSALLYGPFFLFGDPATFVQNWTVSAYPMMLFLERQATFTWEMRVIQALVTVGVTAAVAIRMRRSPHVVWVAPLVLALVRLALDPVSVVYYWLPVELVLLLGLGMVLPRLPRPWAVTALAGFLLTALVILLPTDAETTLARFALTALVTMVALWARVLRPNIEERLTSV